MKKHFLFAFFIISKARLIQKTVDFNDFAQATWSYDIEDVANQDSPLQLEITTKFTEFSFGWNRIEKMIQVNTG